LQLPLDRRIPRGRDLACLLVEKRHPEKNGRKFRINIKNGIRSADRVRDLLIGETFMPQKEALEAT
jgi:hypothetical protein